jgi:RNA-directed DNA polymerase
VTFKNKGMKRIGNLYQQIHSIENLTLAESKARKGKRNQYGVKVFDKDKENNLLNLQVMLQEKSYRTSEYTKFTIYEPKEREIFRLPYFPDRIVHHAVMNVVEPIFTSLFTADTYSCIKKRGIHGAHRALKIALCDVPGTQYCLKLDIKKFYPNIDHDILKYLLRKKFKDKDLLWLFDEIIDSAAGVPIGNYLSQYFANFYLSYFDHWLKEVIGVKYYFRYADDMVVLADNKPYLHGILAEIRKYLENELKLQVKGNYQVFKVDDRGIDVIGYKYYHNRVMLRKRIKKNFARMLVNRRSNASIASYKGWAKHCDSKNLLKKLLL